MRNIPRSIASFLAVIPLSFLLFACEKDKDNSNLALVALLDLPPTATVPQFVNRYSDLAFESYSQAAADAQALSTAVNTFAGTATPSAGDLTNLRNLWVKARASYLVTEGFRFSEGPIDNSAVLGCGAGASYSGAEECEGLLNAWPLDEDAIDEYIGGSDSVTDFSAILAKVGDTSLGSESNADKVVLTGYHAIEYLLWGKDTSSSATGNRLVSDFGATGDGPDRKQYLKTVTTALVGHLNLIKAQWDPATTSGIYRTDTFIPNPDASLGLVVQGLGTFISGEWGGERLTGSFSGEQEEEHSCFSDTTKADFYYDAQGVLNIWTGSYSIKKDVNISTGAGLANLLSSRNQGSILGELVQSRDVFCINLADTETQDPNYTTVCPANSLTSRYDQIILSPNSGDPLYYENTILKSTQLLIGDTLRVHWVNAAAALGITVVPPPG